MSVIHFKFKNRQDYEKVAISGLEVSGKELKEAIMKKKKIGHSNLEIRDAQTKKVYADTDMIKRNASVVVMRSVIPNAAKLPKTQHKDPSLLPSAGLDPQIFSSDASDPQKTSDLTTLTNEEDRLEAMMKQASEGYTAADYARCPVKTGIHPGFFRGPPPRGYVCNRCRKPGHWIQLCPTNGDPAYDKRNKQELLQKTSTVGGSKAKHAAPPPKEKEVPEELKCPICKVPMRDAVVIPCCNKSFCDECIREHLLDKDFTCPLCEAEDVSPDSLKPNKQLRESVKQFKSQVAEEKGIAVASLFSRAGLTPHQLSASHISKPPQTASAALLERLSAARAALPPTSSSSSSSSASSSVKSTSSATTENSPPAGTSSSAPAPSVKETGTEDKGRTDHSPDNDRTKVEGASSSGPADKMTSDGASLSVPEHVRRRSPSSSPSRSKSPSPLDVRRPTHPIAPVRKPPRHPKHPLSLLQPHLSIMTGLPPPGLLQLPLLHNSFPGNPSILNSVPGLGVVQTAPPTVIKDYRAEAEFLLSQKRPRPASPPPLTAEEFYRQQKFLHQFVGHRSPAHSTDQGSAYSRSSGSESDVSDSYSSSGSGSESDESAISRSPSPQKRHHVGSMHRHKKKRGKASLALSKEKERERGRHKKRRREVAEDDLDHRAPKNKRHRHHKKAGKSGDVSSDPLHFSSDAAANSDTTQRRHRHHQHHRRKKGRRHRHRHNRDEGGEGGDGGRGSDLEAEENQVDGGENPEDDLPESERGGGNEVEGRSVPISGDGEGSPAVAVSNETGGLVGEEQVKENSGSGTVGEPTEPETLAGKVTEEQSSGEVRVLETGVKIDTKSLAGGVAERRGSCDRLLDDIDKLLADEKTPTLEECFTLIPTAAKEALGERGENEERGRGGEKEEGEEASVPGTEIEEAESPVDGPSDAKEREGSQGVGVAEVEEENVSLHTEETIDADTADVDDDREGSAGNGLEEGEVLSDSEQPASVLSQNVTHQQKPRLRSVASTVQAVNSETPDLTPSPSPSDVASVEGDTSSDTSPIPPPLPPPSSSSSSLPAEKIRLVKHKHHHHRRHRDRENNDHEAPRPKKKRRTKDKTEKEVLSVAGHHRHKQRKREGEKEGERKRVREGEERKRVREGEERKRVREGEERKRVREGEERKRVRQGEERKREGEKERKREGEKERKRHKHKHPRKKHRQSSS